MIRITKLPNWCITDLRPAFYDTESATAIEQTAKLYAKIQQIIDELNTYINEINKTIEEFINDVNCSEEVFESRITKLIHDYIDYMDTKFAENDKEIKDAVSYMKDNISTSITQIIAEMKEMGQLDEAVINAIDNIGARVTSLETSKTSLETRTTNLETFNSNLDARVKMLETNKPYLAYDETTKELNLIINEGVDE